MSILDNFKKKREAAFIEKLERGIATMSEKYGYNPSKLSAIENMENDDAFTRAIEEYRIWYSGNSRLIRRLHYKSSYDSLNVLNRFWYKAPPNRRMIHTGFPSLISRKMAVIMFGNGYKANVQVLNEDGNINEEKSKEAQDLFNNLENLLNIQEKLEWLAQNESWAGHVFYKYSFDVDLSDYPILEVFTIRDAKLNKKRGVLKEVIFNIHFEETNKKGKKKYYRLEETYGQNKEREATIRYVLFEVTDTNQKIVPLESTDYTLKIKYQESENGMYMQKLDDNDTFTYKGLKCMLAGEKPNLTPSHTFPSSNYGASDYESAIESFDAADEAYSIIIEEIRTNRVIRYIPNSMIPKDENGNKILDDDFTINYMKVEGDPDQNTDNKITATMIEDKTLQHLEKFKVSMTTMCNACGISPITLGVGGLESKEASAESQIERNKATLETRNKKKQLWLPFMEEMFMKAMLFNSWVRENTNANQEAFDVVELDFNNLNITVELNDYIIKSKKEMIDTYGSAIQQGVSSTINALKNINQDWNDEQIEQEYNLIRFEKGMSLDNPMNLLNLTGQLEEENE